MEGRELLQDKELKNKEEKNRKYLIGLGHIVNLVWGEKEQEVSTELRVGLMFGD